MNLFLLVNAFELIGQRHPCIILLISASSLVGPISLSSCLSWKIECLFKITPYQPDVIAKKVVPDMTHEVKGIVDMRA